MKIRACPSISCVRAPSNPVSTRRAGTHGTETWRCQKDSDHERKQQQQRSFDACKYLRVCSTWQSGGWEYFGILQYRHLYVGRLGFCPEPKRSRAKYHKSDKRKRLETVYLLGRLSWFLQGIVSSKTQWLSFVKEAPMICFKCKSRTCGVVQRTIRYVERFQGRGQSVEAMDGFSGALT